MVPERRGESLGPCMNSIGAATPVDVPSRMASNAQLGKICRRCSGAAVCRGMLPSDHARRRHVMELPATCPAGPLLAVAKSRRMGTEDRIAKGLVMGRD